MSWVVLYPRHGPTPKGENAIYDDDGLLLLFELDEENPRILSGAPVATSHHVDKIDAVESVPITCQAVKACIRLILNGTPIVKASGQCKKPKTKKKNSTTNYQHMTL